MSEEYPHLEPQQAALAHYMSDLSEESYSAGWIDGLEFSLWRFLLNGKPDGWWGGETELARLKELSEAAGGWLMWVWGDDAGPKFVPLEEWKATYAAKVDPTTKERTR